MQNTIICMRPFTSKNILVCWMQMLMKLKPRPVSNLRYAFAEHDPAIRQDGAKTNCSEGWIPCAYISGLKEDTLFGPNRFVWREMRRIIDSYQEFCLPEEFNENMPKWQAESHS
jgi:hypothetical protein